MGIILCYDTVAYFRLLCAAPTNAAVQSPFLIADIAKCNPVNEELQAVSTATDGPVRLNAYEIRFAIALVM